MGRDACVTALADLQLDDHDDPALRRRAVLARRARGYGRHDRRALPPSGEGMVEPAHPIPPRQEVGSNVMVFTMGSAPMTFTLAFPPRDNVLVDRIPERLSAASAAASEATQAMRHGQARRLLRGASLHV